MLVINKLSELQTTIKAWQRSGDSVAFVPTMGNLHEGHLKLAKEAQQAAKRVIVSIFINPTQFAVGEDFASYPRTEKEDLEKLEKLSIDLVFLPSVAEIYNAECQTSVTVNGLSDRYCGAFRPGHFSGVATIVCKFFNIIQPDTAVFGLKDYQQYVVISTMIRDLNIPVNIIGIETVREANGLAMSSRNHYLSAAEQNVAALLYQALLNAQTAILTTNETYADIEQQALRFLQQAGFQPEYFSICRRNNLVKATHEDRDIAILVAAKLGKTRLIDNIRFTR